MRSGNRSSVSARLGTVLIVGTGLIGGSFALALKAAGGAERLIGIDRDPGNLDRACALGIVDQAASFAAAQSADLVLIAVPVGSFGTVLEQLAPHLGDKTVLTDVGSTKTEAVEQARKLLGAKFPSFVGGHPISGSDASGADAAFATLFRGRRVVLTPVTETSTTAGDIVAAAWQLCGARVERMDPREHDGILALVSHLPHVLAYALVERVAQDADPGRLLENAAGAFRDVTRIAASSPELWRDICLANRGALLKEIERYRDTLDQIAGYIRCGNGSDLDRLFARARELRQSWQVRGAAE